MGSFPAAAIAPSDSQTLAAWLDALRAGHSLAAVARRAALSRHQVSRCLSGKTVPKLPQFLALVDACSGRLAEFVSRLVDIEQVPSLLSEYRRTVASRDLIFQHPCASAVLAALDVRSDLTREAAPRTLAGSLELDETEVEGALEALDRAGVVETTAGTLRLGTPLLVDTASHPDGARRLRQYWADVAAKRTTQPRRGDMFSHNVFSVSRSDLKLIRNLQSEHYQRLRAIIEKSPPEVVALLNLQLVAWEVR
jgi:DNA-binding phage protein